MKGITFNSKHSYADYNLIMNYKIISTPSKKKIKDSAPGMNSVYDFSTIASNGELIYNQRTIKVGFTLVSYNKTKLHSDLTKIVEWLQDIPQTQLIFDDIKSYYYVAEIEDDIEIKESGHIAEIEVVFIAEPFKTSINLVNSDIWDTFNFEEDVVQDMSFNVVGTKTVSVYNAGRIITPIINSSAAMTVTMGGKTYNLGIGDNKIYGLKLQNGYNSIVINGTGLVRFLFRKVVL